MINQVGLVLRRSPAFNMVGELLADPRAGRPMAVVLRDDQYIPTQGMYGSTWRADRDEGRGGDAPRALDPRRRHPRRGCWARSTGSAPGSRSFHGIEGIEDVVTANLSFASGTVGSLISVWHDVLERPSLRRVEFLCERLHVTVEGDWFGPVRWTFTGEPEQMLENDATPRRAGSAAVRRRQPRRRVPGRGGRGPTGVAGRGGRARPPTWSSTPSTGRRPLTAVPVVP